MLRRSSLTGVALLFALMIPVVFAFAATVFLAPTEVARGKSATVTLSDDLTPDQQIAQDLALADSRVQAHAQPLQESCMA